MAKEEIEKVVEEASKEVAEAVEETVDKVTSSGTLPSLPTPEDLPVVKDEEPAAIPTKEEITKEIETLFAAVKSKVVAAAASVQASISSAIATIKSNPTTATYVASGVAATSVLAVGFANSHKYGLNTVFGTKEAAIVATSLAAVGAGHYIVVSKKKR